MKLGRNDPCGSGRKYKHCCLAAAAAAEESPQNLQWRRVRRALEGFPATMLRFIEETYGSSAIHEAWSEFSLWDETEFDSHTPHIQVFMPWFFHCWAPDPYDTSIENESLHDRAPTRMFLERNGERLDPVLRRYLEACRATPLSFHEIKRCDPGLGFLARDVITGESCEVLERSASRTLKTGDILFGQLVETDGIVMVEACAAVGIPPAYKPEIIQLRSRMKSVTADLFARESRREWDIELRELYLETVDGILHPPAPELHNTDGEKIVFHRLIFEIDSAQSAFDALKHLAFGEAEEGLLESAQYDANGRLRAVAFEWKKSGNRMHRTWENTILGRIHIDGNRLIGEVNSAERGQALRTIVEEALGAGGRHRATEIQSTEHMLEDVRDGTTLDADTGLESARLAEAPEIRQKMTEMMSAHYEDWITQELPALGGRTPLDAVKDPDGREMVEALVLQIERDGEEMNPPLDAAIGQSLRERLGLPAGSGSPGH